MSDPREVVVDQPAPGVMRITLDRPHHMNAITAVMREQLRAAIEASLTAPEVRALILRGNGAHFSSGGDVGQLARLPKPEVATLLRAAHRVVRLLIESEKPVIAAIRGYAAGGGAGIALACDTVLMSEDASLLLPFDRLGLVADCGLFHSLPRRLGWARAHQMLLRPERIGATEAWSIGLCDEMCEGGTLDARALELATRMLRQSPLALAWTKRAMLSQLPPLDLTLELEVEAQMACFASPDFEAGAAHFLTGRRCS